MKNKFCKKKYLKNKIISKIKRLYFWITVKITNKIVKISNKKKLTQHHSQAIKNNNLRQSLHPS